MRSAAVATRLNDILDSVSAIETYIAGLTEDGYRADRLVRDAVERRLVIISDAASHLPGSLTVAEADRPWRRLQEIGERVFDAYHEIDDAAIWRAVTTELKPLRDAVEALLAAVEKDRR